VVLSADARFVELLVFRSVAKFPKKPMVNVDITDNELLKSRRED
jgi:hypothetical protein